MSDVKELTAAQRADLRTVAAMIVPESAEYRVPGADDPTIQADMLATLGRRKTARRARRSQTRCGGAGVPQARWRGGGYPRPCRAAMLLPRRPRAALARARTARAIPERPRAAGRRLVAARSGAGARRSAAAAAKISIMIPSIDVTNHIRFRIVWSMTFALKLFFDKLIKFVSSYCSGTER